MNCRKFCLIALAFIVGVKAFSQVSSPYSSNGIGQIAFQGLPQNFAMGEVGIGTPTHWQINIENPSLLVFNTLSCFQVGIQSDVRKFNTSTNSNKESSLGLRYLALSFPVVEKSKWVTSFALLPLSVVKYHTYSETPIDDNFRAQTDDYGDGGISQLIWANGFQISKSFSIGIKASYVFGSISEQANIKLVIDSLNQISFSDYPVVYNQTTTYKDFTFAAGASYRSKLSETQFLNFGATYSISNKLDGKQDTRYERQTLFGAVIQEQQITSNVPVTFEFPITYGFGASYEKLGKLQVGFDIRNQHWSQTNTQEPGEVYRNATSISIGGQYTPNYQSVNNYFARAKYRLGFSYKESPYILNDTKINDFGINFGLALPMANLSSLDLGFKLGVKGTSKNDLIRENYFQVVLGATMNDRWFIKRRYD